MLSKHPLGIKEIKCSKPVYRSILFVFSLLSLLWAPSPALLASPQPSDSSGAIQKIDLLKTRHTRIRIFPYIFYTPETELAFGVGGIITFYTSEYLGLRPSKLSLSGYYSSNKQYKLSLTPQIYLAQNRLFLTMDLAYGYYLERLYGIGSDTPDTGKEEYAADSWGIKASMRIPPLFITDSKNFKLGLLFDYLNYQVRDTRDNPYFQEADLTGAEGGINSGIGMVWAWDNRDHIFYPTRGGYHQATFLTYFKAMGSDYDFNRIELDLRQYITLRQPHILAIQVFGSMMGHEPPFYSLSKLGGQQMMRGYFEGRYRDKNLLAAQVEYRTHLWRRVGMVAFAGAGNVAPEINQFNLGSTRFSGGAGLRFLFSKEERVNLRMDLGIGQHTTGVYFGIEEAF